MKKHTAKARGRLALLTAVFTVGLVLATPAGALAVSAVTVSTTEATIVADAGVENQMTVTTLPGQITITDSADTLSSSGAPECTGDGTNTVVCTVPGLIFWSAHPGDMADRVQALGPVRAVINGADGDDELTGGPGFSAFSGGNGDDRLIGGTGPETFNGEAGKDAISGGDGDDFITVSTDSTEGDTIAAGAGDDILVGVSPGGVADLGSGNDNYLFNVNAAGAMATVDGGPGIDAMAGFIFAPPASPLTIDLTAGIFVAMLPGTVPHMVPNFEDIDGTLLSGDTLTGTAGPNVIKTGLTDVMRLLSSGIGLYFPNVADTVDPRAGADIVSTGGGDDTINVLDGFSDRVSCGTETDTVNADQFDVLADCEQVTVTRIEPALPDTKAPACQLTSAPRKVSRKAFFRGYTAKLRCDEQVTLRGQILVSAKAAKKKVVLSKVGDVTLAESSSQGAAGAEAQITLKPARRLARGLPRTFGARLVIEARDEFGNSTSMKQRIRVTAPKPKKQGKRRASVKRKQR
jgi:Ca2+-binding RTX toxin-like protein